MLKKLFTKITDGGKTSPTQPDQRPDGAIEGLPDDIRQEYSKHINYLKNMFIDERTDRLAVSLIRRFLEFVWDLPASENHHHSRPFGLFIHSLETAVSNIQSFENKLFFQTDKNNAIDSYKTRTVKPREQYAYFLTGLLYDIGEASKHLISADEAKEESIKTESMVRYLKESINDIPKDSNTQAKFKDLMKGMPDLVTQALDILINNTNKEPENDGSPVIQVDEQLREIYSHVIAGLLHDIGKAAETIVSSEGNVWCPIKEGLYSFCKRHGGKIKREYIEGKTYALHQRMNSVFASRIINHNDYNYIGTQNFAEIMDYFANQSISNRFKKTIEADMQSTAEDMQEAPTRDIAGVLLDTIRGIITSGKYPCNTPMPGMWILEDFTAVVTTILDEARIILQNSGRKIDQKILLKTLVEKKYVVVEDGWRALYQMTLETKGMPFQQKVVQFKNDILWKDIAKPGICNLKVKFSILEIAKK